MSWKNNIYEGKNLAVCCGEAFCKQMTVVPRISAIKHASQKKDLSPRWSLYTLNPKISHLNMQGIEDSQWKLMQPPQETTKFLASFVISETEQFTSTQVCDT